MLLTTINEIRLIFSKINKECIWKCNFGGQNWVLKQNLRNCIIWKCVFKILGFEK
jgi:hypothetical protein